MRKEEYVQAFSQVHAPKALTEKLLQPKLRPNYTRKFAVLAACAVIASILGAFLMGSTDETDPRKTFVSVDWNMYAQLIRVEDEKIEVLDQFEMGVIGQFTPRDSNTVPGSIRMNLNFTMPAGFPYRYSPVENLIDDSRMHASGFPKFAEYYVTTTLWYNTKYPEPYDIAMSKIAVSIKKGYVMMDWHDGQNVYLVASNTPDAEPKDIMTYFHAYMREKIYDVSKYGEYIDQQYENMKIDVQRNLYFACEHLKNYVEANNCDDDYYEKSLKEIEQAFDEQLKAFEEAANIVREEWQKRLSGEKEESTEAN